MQNKPEPKVVYCNNCTFYGEEGEFRPCNRLLDEKSGPIHKVSIRAVPNVHNANNNCPYYKRKTALQKIGNYIWILIPTIILFAFVIASIRATYSIGG